MNLTDSCPSCCHRGVTPAAEKRTGAQIVHGYRCPACQHQWATSRLLTAYSELHARVATRTGRTAA